MLATRDIGIGRQWSTGNLLLTVKQEGPRMQMGLQNEI